MEKETRHKSEAEERGTGDSGQGLKLIARESTERQESPMHRLGTSTAGNLW